MARKSPLEDLLTMLVKLPWWVGVATAAVFWVIGLIVMSGTPRDTIQGAIRPMYKMMFNGLAIFALIAAGVSALMSLSKRKAHDDQREIGSNKTCPQCGCPMVLKTAKRGSNAGGAFYGCSRYPDCKGTRPA